MRNGIMILAAMLAVQGCTSPASKPLENGEPVTVSAHGDIIIEGRSSSLPCLVADLKARGYTPEKTFFISAPDNLPDENRAKIASVLLSAGYRKFMFKGPKKTTSSAGSLPAK